MRGYGSWYDRQNLVLLCVDCYTLMHTLTHTASEHSWSVPFAVAHLKLMKEDGPIIQDGEHELFVYKVGDGEGGKYIGEGEGSSKNVNSQNVNSSNINCDMQSCVEIEDYSVTYFDFYCYF